MVNFRISDPKNEMKPNGCVRRTQFAEQIPFGNTFRNVVALFIDRIKYSFSGDVTMHVIRNANKNQRN